MIFKRAAVVAVVLFALPRASAFSAVRPSKLSRTHPTRFFSVLSSPSAAAQPCGGRDESRRAGRYHVHDCDIGAAAEYESNDAGAQERGMMAQKVVKSAGVALAWYLASSAAAVAVSSATGVAVRARSPRSRYTGLPFLLLAYALSRKDVKERTRLEGVVPRDPASIKLLADDAKDLAMSWGKPAGVMAYTSVDSSIFLFFSRFAGFPFKELFSAQMLTHLQIPDFWLATALSSAFGFAIIAWSRKVGQGYLRSVCASALSPAMHRIIVRPAKAVASMAGMGDGWDLGLTDEQRKVRRPSIELRKSLSTFRDPDFHGDGGLGDSGGAAFPAAGLDDDRAPPNLKRSS